MTAPDHVAAACGTVLCSTLAVMVFAAVRNRYAIRTAPLPGSFLFGAALVASPAGRPFAYAAMVLIPAAVLFFWRRDRNREAGTNVSRGPLGQVAVRIATMLGLPRCGVVILPENPRLWSVDGPAAALRRSLLDVLSRTEIDALIARQLARYRSAYTIPQQVLGYASGIIAAVLAELLSAGMLARVLLAFAAAGVAIAVLALWLPSAARAADRAAIEATGDPDAFHSALEKLAHIQAGERVEPAPEQDRYPTSGDYCAVGF